MISPTTEQHFARIYGSENDDGFAHLIEIYYSDPINTKAGKKVFASYASSGKSVQINYAKLQLKIKYAVSQGIDQSELEGFEETPEQPSTTEQSQVE